MNKWFLARKTLLFRLFHTLSFALVGVYAVLPDRAFVSASPRPCVQCIVGAAPSFLPFHVSFRSTCISTPGACTYHFGVDFIGIMGESTYPIIRGRKSSSCAVCSHKYFVPVGVLVHVPFARDILHLKPIPEAGHWYTVFLSFQSSVAIFFYLHASFIYFRRLFPLCPPS